MQATDPVFYGGTVNGVLTLNGRIACSPVTGRKIDIYSDGSTIYGFGLNDLEYCVFGGEGSAFTYRIAKPGAVDLAGEIALFVNAAGVGVPVGRPISWGSNTLLVDASGALLVNGAAISGGGASGTAAITGGTINGATVGATTAAAGRFTTLFSANVDLEGGAIDNTPIGVTTASTGRFTTLALTGSLAAKSVLAAPNAAAGAPAWRQLLYTDLSGYPQQTSATGLTASTTNTQAGALGLAAAVNNITTAAANSAVRLPNAAPATGFAAEIIVRNGGANAVNCFPPTGSSINALAANAAFSLAAGASARFQQLTATLYITA